MRYTYRRQRQTTFAPLLLTDVNVRTALNGELSVLTRRPLKRFARSLKDTLKSQPLDSDYENEIRAALARFLGNYGKALADNQQGSAADFIAKMLGVLRGAAMRSSKQVPRRA